MEQREFLRLHGFYFEDLEVGMGAEVAKVVSESDVAAFAALSGDDNPLHLNEAFASRTRAGGRIVHGMVTASLISTLVGTRLPGPGSLWINQTLRFLRPVKVGDKVRATATIERLIPARQHAVLSTECRVDGVVVIDGEAVVWVPAATVGASHP